MDADDLNTDALAPTARLRTAMFAITACGILLASIQRGLMVAVGEYRADQWPLVSFDLPNWVLWLALSPAILWSARRWPLHRSTAVHAAALLIMVIVLSVVHTAGFLLYLFLVAGPPQRTFVREAVGLLSWRLALSAFVFGAMLAATFLLDAAARARASAVAAERATADATNARLHALQMQIQPHFLFNALNTVAMLARSENPERAADMITRLADLLRELVVDAPEARVPLRDELRFVERYLSIEQARYGERLRITVTAPDDALDVRVPRLLIQPLVENAVRHGLSGSPTSGAIDIAATRTDRWLTVQVSDDGAPQHDQAAPHEGVGLGNTRSRLRTLYGDSFELGIASSAAGTTVTMRLPVMQILE
jgi:anti-sigma regulatory factor (Ser/Thr protein kinase)